MRYKYVESGFTLEKFLLEDKAIFGPQITTARIIALCLLRSCLPTQKPAWGMPPSSPVPSFYSGSLLAEKIAGEKIIDCKNQIIHSQEHWNAGKGKNAQPHAMRGGHRISSDELCKADRGQAPRLPPPPTPPSPQVMNTQHGQISELYIPFSEQF